MPPLQIRPAPSSPAFPSRGVQCGTILAGGLLGGLAGIMILYSAGLDFTASLEPHVQRFGAAIIFGIHESAAKPAGRAGHGRGRGP